MTKLFKILYSFFIGLFWICTFGFGSTAAMSIIYICYREFGKAGTFAIYGALFLIASVISVLLSMAVDVAATRYKTRGW